LPNLEPPLASDLGRDLLSFVPSTNDGISIDGITGVWIFGELVDQAFTAGSGAGTNGLRISTSSGVDVGMDEGTPDSLVVGLPVTPLPTLRVSMGMELRALVLTGIVLRGAQLVTVVLVLVPSSFAFKIANISSYSKACFVFNVSISISN